MAFILYQSMNLILCALVNINLKYLDSISRNEYLVTISFNYFHTHLIFFRRYREKYKISLLPKLYCVTLLLSKNSSFFLLCSKLNGVYFDSADSADSEWAISAVAGTGAGTGAGADSDAGADAGAMAVTFS